MKNAIGLAVVGLALAACGGSGSSGSGSGGSGSGGSGSGGSGSGGGTSSGGESSYAGPVASTDTTLGQERYASRCGTCHDNGAPQLANLGWSPEQMRRQIREGEGQMPPIPVSRLSNDEMEAVLAYLGTVGALAAQPDAAP